MRSPTNAASTASATQQSQYKGAAHHGRAAPATSFEPTLVKHAPQVHEAAREEDRNCEVLKDGCEQNADADAEHACPHA